MPRPNATIYTVGHGNRSREEFLELLTEAGIRCMVDVRRYPGSRRHPHFARENLEQDLDNAGIRYLFEGERLGGRRKARPDSPHTAIRSAGFRGYADHMDSDAFRSGVADLLALAAGTKTAVMCAERLPWRCHRFFLSDALLHAGARIVHLIETDNRGEHRLNPIARPEGDRLVYDLENIFNQLELDL